MLPPFSMLLAIAAAEPVERQIEMAFLPHHETLGGCFAAVGLDSGSALLRFTVDAEGLVKSAKVLVGSGNTDLDMACLDAVLRSSVTPRAGSRDITGVQVFVP